jgi:FkbM family methyltransferase
VKALKVLARSRSPSFTRHYLRRQTPGEPRTVCRVAWWSGDGKPVDYRRGTSDVALVYDVLFKPGRKSEYWLPEALQPKRVLDIGANIGVTARYLAHRFPNAEIHCFEPIEENLAMLRGNVAGCKVTVHPYGLAAASRIAEFTIPREVETNWGNYSMLARDGDASSRRSARVRAVPEVLGEIGGASIDLIKIDVEGAEADILGAVPDDALAQVTWIYGELHDALNPGGSFGILARLAQWFDIEVHKPMRKRGWFFDACRKDSSHRFGSFRRGR